MKSLFEDVAAGPIVSFERGRLSWLFHGHTWLKNVLKSEGANIVHTQNFRPDLAMSKISLEIPWICTLRNYPLEDYTATYGFLIGRFMAITHFKATKKCRYPVACGQTISSLYRRHGIHSKVIYNGTDLSQVSMASDTRCNTLGKHRIIYTGNLVSRKRVDRVIDLFKSMKSLGLAESLTIVGDGPLRGALERSGGNGIKFVGLVTNVTDYLQGSTIFVLLSDSEGIPNSVLEALACGLPCILSDIPQHRNSYFFP